MTARSRVAADLDLSAFLEGRWLEDACKDVAAREKARRTWGTSWLLTDPAACAERIRRQISGGLWLPRPARQHLIPKPGGGAREISVFAPEDLVLHSALQRFLSARLDPRFHPASHGFRPRRSIWTAGGRARNLLESGARIAVDFDLLDCFGTVRHDRLLGTLAALGVGPALVELIHRLLTFSVRWPGRGLPQGSPLSPVLCNVYLHPVDVEIGSNSGYLRYADDLLVLCTESDDAEVVWQAIAAATAEGGQQPNRRKSGVGPVVQGWRFLGWRLDSTGRLLPPASGAGGGSSRRNCQAPSRAASKG